MFRSLLILVVLLFCIGADYSRSSFRHWVDSDGDCQDTRQEVLIEESLVPVKLSEDGCRVLEGLWLCLYSGQLFSNPSELDVDHLVPLKAAFESGAWAWLPEQKESYANDLSDPDALVVVSSSTNRSKGHRGPSEWMPPNIHSWGWYLEAWKRIKIKYDMTSTSTELEALDEHKKFYQLHKNGYKVIPHGGDRCNE